MAEGRETGLVPINRAVAIFGGLRDRWNALTKGRRTSLSAGMLCILIVTFGLVWYASRPEWKPLFSGLEGRDVAQVSQELGAAGIRFQSTLDGAGIEVPGELMDKARMAVAAKGMPQSGRMGFELFDKPNWVGSEFDERVNYQRALEGELEHTIQTLGAVQSARVHLVLPQASLFVSEQRDAKASVVLKLRRAHLAPEQIESIRNLVAGAVENLNASQVTLVDADGRIDLTGKQRENAAGAEQAIEARLISMLEPLAGIGNVRATVNVSYDLGHEERTDEVYDPSQSAVLSTQKNAQTNGNVRAAQGVPGTASNSPAAAPKGAVQGSEKAAAAGTPSLLSQNASLPVLPQSGSGLGQSTSEESSTFAVTRHLVHTEEGPGRIQRLTAAVVVNDRQMTEGAETKEHTVWKPRTTEEMHRLESLAQAAVGFDEKRGDQVVIQNVSFSSNAPEPKMAASERAMDEAKALLLQPTILRTLALGATGMALIWFVLKPIANQTVALLRESLEMSNTARPLLEEPKHVSVTRDLTGHDSHSLSQHVEHPLTGRNLTGRKALEDVTKQIRMQPLESTRLLETWITSEAGTD